MSSVQLSELNVPFIEGALLKDYTTFKVGGACKAIFFPTNEKQLYNCLQFAKDKNEAYFVLGNGSNVLASDSGFDGYVISTLKLNKMKLCGNILQAECGVKVCDAVKLLTENCFSGLEFASGIPATIGGLVAMNAGCFNKNIAELVCYVKSSSGVYNNKNCEFGYRKSRFVNDVIYSVGLKLTFSEREAIDKKIEHYYSVRKSKQPKGNSCGSVFLNEGFFAGKIIDQAGLKGYQIGGACVSKEHANFIINNGGKASDIFNLIRYVKETVLKRVGVELNEEVKYIGQF